MKANGVKEDIGEEIAGRLAPGQATAQETADGIPTFWIPGETVVDTLRFLKTGVEKPYNMLYDLSAIDERARGTRPAATGAPAGPPRGTSRPCTISTPSIGTSICG